MPTQVTYNKILKAFNDIATAHYQINSYGVGDVWDITTSGTINYPLCYVVPQDGSLSGKYYNSNFTIIFMDLTHKDLSDADDVTNDMELVAMDFIAQLQKPTYDFLFKPDNVPFKRFTERFDDEVTGVAIDITIQVPYIYDRCAIPASLINVSNGESPACSPVSIVNQLGTLITTVASGGTYQVIQVSTIDGGASNTTYTNSIIQP